MYILNLFKNSYGVIESFNLSKEFHINYSSKVDNLYTFFNNESKLSLDIHILNDIINSLEDIGSVEENLCLKFHNSIIDFSDIKVINSSNSDILLYDLIKLNTNIIQKNGNCFNESLLIFPNIYYTIEYLNYFLNLKVSLKLILDKIIITNFLKRNNGAIKILGMLNTLNFNSIEEIVFYLKWDNYFKNINNFKPINCPKNTKLILPMAGLGTRFSIKGFKVPKPFIKVSGKPMIIKAIECLPLTGSQYLGCLKDHIEIYKLKNNFENYFKNINIIPIEKVTSGQAITCQLILQQIKDINEPILISACDNGIYYNNTLLHKLFNDDKIDIIVFAYKNQESSYFRPEMYSWLDIDEFNSIKYVHCKHFPFQTPLNNFAIIGTMFFKEAKYFLNGLKQNITNNIKNNGEFYVDEVINRCIESGLRIKMFEVYNYICWGTPEDLETYNFWESHFVK